METHSKGKHRYFKPDTKVLFISPSFMKRLMRPRNNEEMVSTSYNTNRQRNAKCGKSPRNCRAYSERYRLYRGWSMCSNGDVIIGDEILP
jgi:hypothetical protein